MDFLCCPPESWQKEKYKQQLLSGSMAQTTKTTHPEKGGRWKYALVINFAQDTEHLATHTILFFLS